ncbi:MAG: hypothetical protein KatS3mg019_0476 [Fimbriimonadales bacterium]|nr:MAG: hypothetical protein KatS3mg019_0476 [Fimbriimonadales bacterium]
MAITREDLKELPSLLQSEPELQLEVARAVLTVSTVSRLMREDPELRETFRRAVYTDELVQLPRLFREYADRTDTRLEKIEADVGDIKRTQATMASDMEEMKRTQATMASDMEEAKRTQATMASDMEEMKRTQAATASDMEEVKRTQATMASDMEEMKRTQAATASDMEATKDRQEAMEAKLDRIEREVIELKQWQQGETARREGERYESLVVRNAPSIFGGGMGGSPTSESVQQRLSAILEPIGFDYAEEDSPFSLDLVWWKGERFAVAEISLKVNGSDVRRAKRRAEVLRKAGVDVLPVVIGSQWAHPQTPSIAQREGVAWRISNQYSPELIEFHRYRPASNNPQV